jgi:hypothetical protein
MGCSPYFAVTGAHPILPFDIAEATYLQLPPTSIMSLTDLISCHAITLQKCFTNVNALYSKVYQAQLKAACQFEQQHLHTLKDFDFQHSSLVLMCNTQIKKSLNKKMHTRYIGPLIVVSHTYGSVYILSELDGTVLHCPIAAFCLLPCFLYKSIPLPQVSLTSMTLAFIKWSTVWMQMEMKKTPTKTPQTISLNKALLSLSIYFPLSFYHFPLSDISLFIPKT